MRKHFLAMSKFVNGLKMKFNMISSKGVNMLDVINKLSFPSFATECGQDP